MENSSELVKLGVAIALVATVIIAAMVIRNLGQNKLTSATESLMEATSELDNADLVVYDGISVQGAEVINVIERYKDKTTFYINVIKKSQQTNELFTSVGIGTLYGHAGSYTNIRFLPLIGSTETEEVALNSVVNMSDSVSVGEDGTISANTQGTLPTPSYAKTYNKAWNSNDEWYIPENKIFKGSIQRDIDGNISLITFVQQ